MDSWMDRIEYLVFAAGGVRGFMTVGALLVLEHVWGTFDHIKGAAGSSIGSLFALLMVLGCSASDTQSFILEQDMQAIWRSLEVWKLEKRFGLVDRQVLRRPVHRLLNTNGLVSNITFAQLRQATERDLVITTVNLNTRKLQVCSAHTTPDWQVAECITASMSIPIVFEPTLLSGHFHVDGGLLCGLPVQVFDMSKTLSIDYKVPESEEINGLTSYVSRALTLCVDMINTMNLQIIPEAYQKQRMVLDSGELLSVDFDIKFESKVGLIENGVKQASVFLLAHSDGEHVDKLKQMLGIVLVSQLLLRHLDV